MEQATIKKTSKKTRMIFPMMILFLILYILASPEKFIDRLLLFRNQATNQFPQVGERSIDKEIEKQISQKHVEGEVVIKFNRSINFQDRKTGISAIDQISGKYDIQSTNKIDFKNLDNIYVVKINDDNKLEGLIGEYLATGYIEWAEPNYKARMTVTNPNDPKFQDGTQWALNQAQDHDIDAPEGWDHGTGSPNTVIAVIDSGVDLDHPDLDANIWNNAGEMGGGKENNSIDDDANGYTDDWRGWDWVTSYNNAPADNDPNPEPDGINNDGWYGIDDGVTHGSHVSGIASAETNNATGIAGVCWTCKIMALRVLDDEGWGDYDEVALAIEYATDNGADVINMSLAGGFSYLMDDIIEYAFINNVVIVAATANSATDISLTKLSPVCNDQGENMIIGVAATTSSDRLAIYSNYGWHYTDVTAPGSSIYSTLYTNDPAHGFNTDYGYMSGTSMATPHVAGLAGLVKSAHPTWTVKEVRDKVIDLTNNIDGLNSLYQYKIGSGRINAKKSLDDSSGVYPSGTFLRLSGTNRYYVVDNGLRRRLGTIDGRVTPFLNYFHMYGKTVTVSQQVLNYYPPGPALRYRDGMTLATRTSGKIYTLSDFSRRYFSSSALFRAMHYDPSDLFWNYSEYKYYHLGESIISYNNVHPDGSIIRYFDTWEGPGQPAHCYRVENGKKRRFASTTFLRLYYNRKLAYAPLAELASYPNGEDIRWYDGKLIGDEGTSVVYFIEYNRKRAFPSMDVFNNLGFDQNDILWDAAELNNYVAGEDMPSNLASP